MFGGYLVERCGRGGGIDNEVDVEVEGAVQTKDGDPRTMRQDLVKLQGLDKE